jgi:hypothetical protein
VSDDPVAHRRYRVFISHAGDDGWVASQIADRLRECGADTFLDNTDIAKGDEFKRLIFTELGRVDELLALLTPWATQRNWVWVEIGAACVQGKRVVPVLYRVTLEELDAGGGRAALDGITAVKINEINRYFDEVRKRVAGADDA